MREITVKLHSVAEDGLPDIDALCGRVLFLCDGDLYAGWPITSDEDEESDEEADPAEDPEPQPPDPDDQEWEASSDSTHGIFTCVRYWIELPVSTWELEPARNQES